MNKYEEYCHDQSTIVCDQHTLKIEARRESLEDDTQASYITHSTTQI